MPTFAGLTCAALVGCAPATPPRQEGPDSRLPIVEMRAGRNVSDLDALDAVMGEMAGIWRSNGYGYLVDLRDDEPRLFHITGDVCLGFSQDEGSLFDVIDSARVSPDGSRLLVGASPEPHVYEFDRLAALPQHCLTPPTASSPDVFGTFVSYMAEHYAFFDLYGVDWEARTALARAELGAVSDDSALFNLLASMLEGIEDGHLELVAEIDGQERSFDPGEAAPYRRAIAEGHANGLSERTAKRAFDTAVWVEGIDADILGGEGVSLGNGWIRYGIASPVIGYIATFTAGGFAARDFSDPIGDLRVVEAAFDAALAAFEAADVDAVIFDASLNHGGYDFISRAMAAHFAPAPVLAYSKHAGDATDPYRTDIVLQPSTGRRFTGDVYFVTSDITVSAAEILTLTMRALPNVTHVGQPTRGAFSDILEKPLPNGWVLTLSNEIYADGDAVVWEGPGVTPDMLIDVFVSNDPAADHAAAIRRIIDLAEDRRDAGAGAPSLSRTQ